MVENRSAEYVNTVLALALIKYLYNKGAISEKVYKSIQKEYCKIIENP